MTVDLFHLETAVWIAAARTDVPVYDFDFPLWFSVRRPLHRPDPVTAIGRFGAAPDYDRTYAALLADSIELIHDPNMHLRASSLPDWYPSIADLTPRSRWYDQRPSAEEVEQAFGWPVFIKGSRQTARHSATLSVARSREDYDRVATAFDSDPILSWQQMVIREYFDLRRVPGSIPGKLPPAFEFRTFWWRGSLVGAGRYHIAASPYDWDARERDEAISLAQEVAQRMDVTFLVVDLAQCEDGRWVVIELNDGQESGYAGVSPTVLWQKIVQLERQRP